MSLTKSEKNLPSKILPTDEEILQAAVLHNYCNREGDWNKKTDIFADGFMLGWDLAFERVPKKPPSKEEIENRKVISKLVKMIKDKQIPIEI